jgi:outer membrane protein TolC
MLSAAVMLSAAAKQVVAAEQAVTLVQREVELTEERLAAGVADNLEVFQAQSALSQVRAARIQALAQHVMARVNWALALGTIEQFQW